MLTEKLKVRPDLMTTNVDGQIIVYDTSNNDCHVISTSAARVWAMCDGNHSVADMVNIIHGGHDSAPRLSKDDALCLVDTALGCLREKGLLLVADGINRRDLHSKFFRPALAAGLVSSILVPAMAAHASEGSSCDGLDEEGCDLVSSCTWIGMCIDAA